MYWRHSSSVSDLVRFSLAIGAATAAAMLDARDDDGRFVPFSFSVGDDAGEWRPTPPGLVNDPFA